MTPGTLFFNDSGDWQQQVDVLTGPTPVASFQTGGEPNTAFWVKDDGCSARLYGGNKPRKLAFLLGQALASGYHSVVTSGALGSHHCLATAILGREFGFNVHLILFPQPVNNHVRNNFLRMVAAGANVTLGNDYNELPELIRKVQKQSGAVYEILQAGHRR